MARRAYFVGNYFDSVTLDPADFPPVDRLTEDEARKLAGDIPPWEPTRGSVDTIADYFSNYQTRERRQRREWLKECERQQAAQAAKEDAARERWEAQQAAAKLRQQAEAEEEAARRAAWEAAAPERRRLAAILSRDRHLQEQKFLARAFQPGELVTLCGPKGERYPAQIVSVRCSFTETVGRADYVLKNLEHGTFPTVSLFELLTDAAVKARRGWGIERVNVFNRVEGANTVH